MKCFLGVVSAIALAGCAGMVTSNTGDSVTIEHDGFVSIDSAREVAIAACKQNGKTNASLLRSANKNPRFATGTGVQFSTFACE